MVKSKQQSSSKPSNKSKTATPKTADDFQALADDEENRGGKWRAGDASKSARAFERAISFYEQGLQSFPLNFDLAYNKARLELEVSQQPALLPHWGLSHDDFLAQTLRSHRQALSINDDDVDLLFNTAQVLTSLAEELSEQGREAEAVPLLHEALELLSSCLAKQEMLLEQQSVEVDEEEDDDDANEADGGVSLREITQPQTVERKEETATIIQPISINDLLDTVHASFSALTTLVNLESEHAFDTLNALAHTLYSQKTTSYITLLADEAKEKASYTASIDWAIFLCALANAQFTSRQLQWSALLEALDTFNVPGKATHASGLLAEAEARLEAVISAFEQQSSDMPVLDSWKQLSLAQDSLTQATKLNDANVKEIKSQLYKQKGDVELVRIRIASFPSPVISDAIRNNRGTLLKNAKTFYKAAVAHAALSEDESNVRAAQQRMAAVDFLVDVDAHSQPNMTPELHQDLSDMIDEGVLDPALADQLASMHITMTSRHH